MARGKVHYDPKQKPLDVKKWVYHDEQPFYIIVIDVGERGDDEHMDINADR